MLTKCNAPQRGSRSLRLSDALKLSSKQAQLYKRVR